MNDDQLTSSSMVTLLILIMAGTGILSLPRFLIEASNVDSWLIILTGGIILAFVAFLYGHIISKFPGKGYFEILSSTLTKPIAYIVSITYIIYMIIIVGLGIRIFSETLKGSLFPTTPIEVIMVSMLAAGAYGARKSIGTLGRLAKVLFIITTPAALIIFGLGLFNAKFVNLLPVFEIEFKDLIYAVPRVFFSFTGFEMILIFGMFLDQPKKAQKAAWLSVILVTFLYLFIHIITLANFGPKQTLVLVWPVVSLIKNIQLPLAFIEDLTSIGVSIWFLTVFMSYLPSCIANSILLKQMTGSKENSFFSIIQIPFLYIAAMVPSNIVQIYVILDKVTKYLGPILLFIVPLFILISMKVQSFLGKEVKPNA